MAARCMAGAVLTSRPRAMGPTFSFSWRAPMWVLLPDHESSGGLAREECSLHVHRHGEIVILDGDILGGISRRNACVVHKDVEAAKFRDRIMHGALNLIDLGHIHLQSDGAAPHRPDFSEQPRIRIDVPQPQRYVRPDRKS